MHARIGWQGLRKSEFLPQGDYYIITGTDFSNGGIDFNNVSFIAKDRYDQDKHIQLKEKDILLTKDGTLGKVAFIDKLPKPATLNAGVYVLRPLLANSINAKYLFHYLSTENLLNYATKRATGGTIKHLNQNILVSFPIPITTLDEEAKISKLLNLINKTINIQHHKYELLRQLKQGFLQKIFTNKNSQFPKIRFNHFNDKWKQCKLGDISKVIGGGTPSTSNLEYWGGDINWYSPMEIGNKMYVKTSKKHITKEGLQHSAAKLLPGKRTILFTSRAGIGDMAIMLTDGTTNQGFQSWVIDPKSIDIHFLYSLGSRIKRIALRKASGSTFLEISNSEIKKINLKIPSFAEQKRIGNFLKNIEKNIENQKKKLDNLQQIKKFLLQNMFV